jgi:hypothetical protein
LGNVHENTLSEIYNGELYNDFRRRFLSATPPDVCAGCRFSVPISKHALLDRIGRPEGLEFRFEDGVLMNMLDLPLQRDQMRLVGAFDVIDQRIPGLLRISGWIGDRRTWKPPQACLITYPGREQQLMTPSDPRPDLSSVSVDLVHSGFTATIECGKSPFRLESLRMFVIFDNHTYAEMRNDAGVMQ